MAEIGRHRNGHAVCGRTYKQLDHRAGAEVLQRERASADQFERLQPW